VVAEHAGERSF